MDLPHSKHSPHVSIQINLSDGPSSEIWIRKIQESIKPHVRSIDIVFVAGGPKIEPSALLSLRNALLRIPDEIFVRTIATTSLSPFSCVAWFLGDERWIADDARLWIPQLPEPILRGNPNPKSETDSKPDLTRLSEPDESESSEDDNDESLETFLQMATGSGPGFEEAHRSQSAESECGCRKCRLSIQLRSLASIVNEWFPSWEYSGSGIDTDTLIELRVIRPEWVFGAKTSRRGSARHIGESTPPPPDGEKEASNWKLPPAESETPPGLPTTPPTAPPTLNQPGFWG